MRLLNTFTFRLKEFHGSEIPEYVILSHTWGSDEITFQEIQEVPLPSHKRGYLKIQHCCAQAVRDGYEWAWIDTCCIDKSSSAELSESINSMFKWYQSARICYVYLEDCFNSEDIMQCRWWTRGWTLQELIAPTVVEFYDAKWRELGTKLSLHEQITKATGIDREILNGVNLFDRNVGVRMSWTANRKTTRKEDQAYCLLGLFGVHMPLLYGEGERAFTRLQEEIMKVREDYTLFVWCPRSSHIGDGPGDHRTSKGLLADSPADFVSWKEFQPSGYTSTSTPSQPWAFTDLSRNCFALFPTPPNHEAPYMTSRGLRITLPIFQEDIRKSSVLACVTVLDEGTTNEKMACVVLLRLSPQSSQYVRRSGSDLTFLRRNRHYDFGYQSIYVIRPRSQTGISAAPTPRQSSIALLMVNFINRCEVDLQCLFSPWLSMADLLSLGGEFGIEEEPGGMALQRLKGSDRKSAQDRLRRLGSFLMSAMAQKGTCTSSFNEEMATHCFGMAPEHCWFVDTDSWPSQHGNRIRGVLGFGSLQHAHCAFRVQIGLFEEKTMCTVVGSTTDAIQNQTNQRLYTRWAQEAIFDTDRMSVCLEPQALFGSGEGPAGPSFELSISLRRVATSPLGIKRYLLSMSMAQCDVHLSSAASSWK